MRDRILDILQKIRLMPWAESSETVDELLLAVDDDSVPESWKSLATELSTLSARLASFLTSDELNHDLMSFSETLREMERVVSENAQTVGDVCAGIRREFDNLREEIKFLTMERDAARAESKRFEDALKRALESEWRGETKMSDTIR